MLGCGRDTMLQHTRQEGPANHLPTIHDTVLALVHNEERHLADDTPVCPIRPRPLAKHVDINDAGSLDRGNVAITAVAPPFKSGAPSTLCDNLADDDLLTRMAVPPQQGITPLGPA